VSKPGFFAIIPRYDLNVFYQIFEYDSEKAGAEEASREMN